MINLVFLFSGVGRLDLAFEQVGGLGNSLVVECERAFLDLLLQIFVRTDHRNRSFAPTFEH